MTIAAVEQQSIRYGFGTRYDRFWIRLISVGALMLADLLCFAAADLVLGFASTPPALALFGVHVGQTSKLDLIVVLGALFVITRYIAGDYSRRQLFWDGARITTRALLFCFAAYMVPLLLVLRADIPLSLVVWLVLFFAVPMARQAARYLLGQAGLWLIPTAIFGTTSTACEVLPALGNQLSLGLKVLWVMPENAHTPIPDDFKKLKPLLAPPETIIATLTKVGCRQVIVVPDDRLQMLQNDLIDQLIGADIRVAIVPSLRRLPLFGLSTSYFFGKDLLLLQVRNNLARLPQRILKRTVDIVGAVLALILLSPLFAVLAFLIKREDGGPVLFIQKRVGRHGHVFACWKFRTMSSDAEDQMKRWETEKPELLAQYRHANFKLASDPRVTRVGAWIRRKSLDELPQLVNVLRGEMSLVGPRPLLSRELADYGAVISLYKRVRPGITGLWQISGRSHTTFAERVSYDEWYIKNWTVWYDVVILLHTVRVLVQGDGAY